MVNTKTRKNETVPNDKKDNDNGFKTTWHPPIRHRRRWKEALLVVVVLGSVLRLMKLTGYLIRPHHDDYHYQQLLLLRFATLPIPHGVPPTGTGTTTYHPNDTVQSPLRTTMHPQNRTNDSNGSVNSTTLSRSSPNNQPYFILHVGPPKTATTSLQVCVPGPNADVGGFLIPPPVTSTTCVLVSIMTHHIAWALFLSVVSTM